MPDDGKLWMPRYPQFNRFLPRDRAKEAREAMAKDRKPRCSYCGRPLYSPTSRFLLLGQTCLKKIAVKHWERWEVEEATQSVFGERR